MLTNKILIGFKSCGKSTVGKALAEQLNKSFIDTDLLIEQAYLARYTTNLSCREIFQNKGEVFFRQLEKEIIADLVLSNSIIAVGGGSLVEEANQKKLKKLGQLIYLNTSFTVLLQRLESQGFPAYLDAKDPYESFKDYYLQREPRYKLAADYEVKTDSKLIEEIVREIIVI